jgi:hypothetical protein
MDFNGKADIMLNYVLPVSEWLGSSADEGRAKLR